MSIELIGSVKLARGLKTLLAVGAIKKVVQVNTSEMQQKMQRKVAVDTGNLKRSLAIDFEDGGFTGSVSTDVHYAAAQETGTRFQSGTPYALPSFREQEVKFKKDLQKLMK